jgi:plastocyanin
VTPAVRLPAHLSLALLAAAAALPLSACGSDDTSLDATAAGAPSPVPVHIRDYRFDPKHLIVRRGARLAVSNDGEVAHNLTIERGSNPRRQSDALLGTGSFLPGRRVDLRVDLPAGRKYAFACTVPGHRDLGMYGTVRVR